MVTYEGVFVKAVCLQSLDNPSNTLVDCAHLQISRYLDVNRLNYIYLIFLKN